jgi:hypothetical protein
VVTLTSVFIQPDYGITVTPESAAINGVRKRVIDWRDIADITVENRYGYRTVVIKEFSGQSFRLLAPSSFFLDQNFEDKVNTMRLTQNPGHCGLSCRFSQNLEEITTRRTK